MSVGSNPTPDVDFQWTGGAVVGTSGGGGAGGGEAEAGKGSSTSKMLSSHDEIINFC